MVKRVKIKISSKFITFLAFFALAYTVYVSVKAGVRYQRLNQEIKKTEEEIAQLQEQNRQLKNLIIYLKSNSFKEKKLREHLGYIKPGEKVIYFKDDPVSQETSLPPQQQKEKPNWQLWLEYLKITKS